jgi:hypothetical protein
MVNMLTGIFIGCICAPYSYLTRCTIVLVQTYIICINLQPRIIKLLNHHEGLPQNVINIQCGDFPKRGYIPPNHPFFFGMFQPRNHLLGPSPYRGDSPWHFAHGTRVQRGWWDLRSAGGVTRRVGIPLAFQTAVSCFCFSPWSMVI